MRRLHKLATACSIVTLAAISSFAAEPTNTFTVAAYNVENWLLMERDGKTDQPKPSSQKTAVFAVLAKIRPDVLSVEEMGTTNELAELTAGLRAKGLDYRYREWIEGGDTTRHVALLSRFPIVARFSRTDYTYLLKKDSRRIERGILDVKIQVNDHYAFRAVVAHLKSKRQVDVGDQAAMRLEEAKLLRAHIGKALKDDPHLNLIAIGDFNDTPESEPIHAIIGVAPFALVDLLPVDSKGGHDTHYWAYRKLFSRIDYLITSPGMSNEYVPGSAHIADVEDWNKASDHRAVYAKFYAYDVREKPASRRAESTHTHKAFAMICVILAGVIVGPATIAVISRRRPAPRS